MVEKAYREGLQIVYQSQLAADINQGIKETAQHLDAIASCARGRRPVVAITGDVYTRVNPVANADLFNLLEELGLRGLAIANHG